MINLLPPNRINDLRYAWANTILRRYIALVIISMLVVSGVIAGAYLLSMRQKDDISLAISADEKRIKSLEPVQKDAQQLSATINTISNLLKQDVRFSQMLTEIAKLMPAGSALTALQVNIEDAKAPIMISADVDSEAKAAVLRNNLEQSDLFSSADIKNIKSKETEATAGTGGDTSTGQTEPSRYKFTASINAVRKGQEAGSKK